MAYMLQKLLLMTKGIIKLVLFAVTLIHDSRITRSMNYLSLTNNSPILGKLANLNSKFRQD